MLLIGRFRVRFRTCLQAHRSAAVLSLVLLAVLSPWNSLSIASESKSNAQKVLEVLDGVCIRNEEDFTNIDGLAQAFGWREIDSTLVAADPVMRKRGGSAYAARHDGIAVIVAYARGAGCSIVAEDVNHDLMEELLLKNYKLKLVHTGTSGIQIEKVFRFRGSSPYDGGLITLVHGKPETKIEAISIGFIPSKVWNKNRKPAK